MSDLELDENIWKALQKRLDYSNEEMETFKKNPRNQDILSKANEQFKKTIVMEIVESHGCISQHKVGSKLYFDGAGNLLTKLCPSKICYSALYAASNLIFAATELFYAGVDANDIRFKRVGCGDVGLQCGGWGHIVMELKVEDRERSDHEE
jgi:hypothetical protein